MMVQLTRLIFVLLLLNVWAVEECGVRKEITLAGRKATYLINCGQEEEGVPIEKRPMIVALHCFGCYSFLELDRYQSILKSFGKVILVAPDGIGQSWNAVECCGTAVSTDVDDVSFIDSVIDEVAIVTGLHNGQIATTGFSNGGFMSMHLTQHSRHQIAAAAAMSGYRYERPTRSTAVLLHHSLNDDKVLSTGCCSSSQCCCRITSPYCRSTTDWHLMWSAINNCSPSSRKVETRDSTCYHTDCETTTVLCEHATPTHSTWARASPGLVVERDILEFIFGEFCKSNDGCPAYL
eukprot:TRINITY_DN11197_c0_g1_i3.p1 TRINITY_DN11197_c0_g1~~TRINITY_DN11197_c0_g1_i3.p1  ORF type:complete len:293 (+),score=39.48 TRINITY_DN11197_c0_g1_i3:874-1752(+)